jgi:outer membrane protein assembly factor BamB
VLWERAIPGLGHSSPIVWGNRVFVTTAVAPGAAQLKVGLYGDIASVYEREPQQWRLLALDKATGWMLWDKLALESVPRVKRHPKSTHCSSTPATDGDRLVAIFGSEGLFCFDLTGQLLWKRDLGPMEAAFFAVPSAQWGFASSPVIHEGKVIVQCDVLTNCFVAAYALADGRELWRTLRGDVPTWSTPTVLASSDRTQVLVNGWHHSGGYDLATGRELWRLDGGGDIPVPTPIAAHGLVYLTSAHGRYRPMRAIHSNASGDITPPEIGLTNAAIAWVHPRRGNYMQTPIVVGAWLFACQDSGVLTCFDARTGLVHYSERLGPGGQGFTASPVAADGRLYFASETGNVYVVPATNRFSVLATNQMRETCMASPALSAGTLFIRTRGKLVAIGGK